MLKVNDNIYYCVNGKRVFDKIEAILLANKTLSDISWHFHQDVYSTLNWLQEPEQSLDTYYKDRALQIREKYDYIVAMVSGGADSTNMTESFVKNNIRLDEIVAGAPLSGIKNFSVNNKSTNSQNTISETVYSQIPYLQYISDNFPQIKITINDYFNSMIEYKDDEWLYNSSDFIHPSTVARFDLNKLHHLKKLADAGKKICVLYGVDKPVLHISETNNIYIVFTDLAVNVPRSPFTENYDNVNVELFYWNDYNPNMMVKSAHQTIKWLFKNNLSHLIRTSTLPLLKQKKYHSMYQRSIYPAIYPTSKFAGDPQFQAAKPVVSFMAEHDEWVYSLHNKTRMLDMMKSNFRDFIKNIDNRYFLENKIGFNVYYNNYQIGTVNDFKKITNR